jgi:hypothetical protein
LDQPFEKVEKVEKRYKETTYFKYTTMNQMLVRTFKTFIKHHNLPTCIKCAHFMENKTNYPYDVPSNDKERGKCKLFGKQDMVTGEISYSHASLCRIDESKCGEKGQYFIKEH